MNCQFCKHPIDMHRFYRGCGHTVVARGKARVCPCQKKPSEIVAELEEAARELVDAERTANYVSFKERQDIIKSKVNKLAALLDNKQK
jgi:hypothetical protein